MGPQTPHYGYYGEQKKKLPWKMIGLALGGVIVLFIIIFVISSFLNRNSIGTQSAHLSVRLTNLSTLTTAGSNQLTNGQLKKVTAETAIINDGVQSNLVFLFPKKADKSIVAAESNATDTTKLSNAALAGTYDKEYKQVLTQRLESISALLTEMYSKSKSRTTKATINDDYKNYQLLLSDLNKITL